MAYLNENKLTYFWNKIRQYIDKKDYAETDRNVNNVLDFFGFDTTIDIVEAAAGESKTDAAMLTK